MRPVHILGLGQLPIRKESRFSLEQMGVKAARLALEDAGVEMIDALYVGSMLADELQSQKNLAALIVDGMGLVGIEAVQASAASASGAAAIRLAYLAVASGAVNTAMALGVEKMSDGETSHVLAKALDKGTEQMRGETMISLNAELMSRYIERYAPPEDAFANFSVNAHANAAENPFAMFQEGNVTIRDVTTSRIILDPIRLFDCSPICDGAAAIILTTADNSHRHNKNHVRILSSTVSTDRASVQSRREPLWLEAVQRSTRSALESAGLTQSDIDVFEAHDAFSILACLSLEAAGFATPGGGWRLARDGGIGPNGILPLSTMGGLKARGHPIGATPLYQACELANQLLGLAGKNQVPNARIGMIQSLGGLATNVFTHILVAA